MSEGLGTGKEPPFSCRYTVSSLDELKGLGEVVMDPAGVKKLDPTESLWGMKGGLGAGKWLGGRGSSITECRSLAGG